MMAINWDDPNTQGLMTLAAGLLQNSGWSKTPITLGQAFGQAAPEALNTMQRIKRFNMEAADTDQQRQLRGAQLQKVLFENQMDGLLPGQMSMLQRFPGEEVPQADPNIAMREQLLGPFAGGQQGDWADPVVRPFSPAQAPAGQVLPEDAQAISAPQAPASGVPQETLVIGDQAKTLDEMANRMEDRLSMPPNPNNPSVPWHPQAIAAEQRKIAGIRARAERIRKEFDRDRAAPKTEVEVSEDGTKQRNVAWNPKTQKYDIPLGGWRQVFSDKPLVGGIYVDATSYDKTGGKERAIAVQERQTSAMKAADFSAVVDLVTDSLEGFGGGGTTEWQAAFGRFFPESEYGKISSIQDVQKSILGKNFGMIRATGSGATSDYEAKQFLAAFPSLAQTPQGRQFMKMAAKKIANREIIAADVYAELAEKGPVRLEKWHAETRKRVGDLFTKEELKYMQGRGPAPGGRQNSTPTVKPWEKKWN